MEKEEVQVIPLHHRKELIEECAQLLNTYWSRSLNARIQSLEISRDSLPCSLIMVRNHAGKSEVIGHAKIMEAQGVDKACYIESVFIREDLRGKGYGKKIMLEAEKYSSGKGFKQMFLNTLDKQDFYSHLGYKLSHPILTLGANAHRIPQAMIDQLTKTNIKNSCCKSSTKSDNPTNTSQNITCSTQCSSTKTCPDASVPSPPAAPQAPPAPPLPKIEQKCTGTANKHVMDQCCDPTKVTWMKKDI